MIGYNIVNLKDNVKFKIMKSHAAIAKASERVGKKMESLFGAGKTIIISKNEKLASRIENVEEKAIDFLQSVPEKISIGKSYLMKASKKRLEYLKPYYDKYKPIIKEKTKSLHEGFKENINISKSGIAKVTKPMCKLISKVFKTKEPVITKYTDKFAKVFDKYKKEYLEHLKESKKHAMEAYKEFLENLRPSKGKTV